MINERTLKLLKWDTLDVNTLKAIIQIVNERKGLVYSSAILHSFKGDYSPTKVKVREDELITLYEFLRSILLGVESLRNQGE